MIDLSRQLNVITLKVSGLVVTGVAIVLVLVYPLVSVTQLHDSQQRAADSLAPTLATLIAFDDSQSAETAVNVLASLAPLRGVTVWSLRDRPFAVYGQPLQRPQRSQQGPHTAWSISGFVLSVPIHSQGERVGTLAISAGFGAIFVKTLLLALGLGLICAAALLIAAWGNRRFSLSIVDPLQNLTQAISSVAEDPSHGALAARSQIREIDTLALRFNDLVKQINERDRSLAAGRVELEREVDARTHDLRLAKEAAEQASTAKSEFLARMSHEIRTPIHGVRGLTEILLRSTLDRRQRRFIETLQRSNLHLLNVINEILDLSKVEAGKLELESINFDLPLLAQDVADAIADQAAAKSLELRVEIPDTLPRVAIGDPVRLRQILLNLLSNAIKFTAEGYVGLNLEALDSDDEGFTLRILVEDTGIGIPSTVQNQIFESFSQADGSTTRQFGGTGLGLTICRQLVELMGGEIGVESEPGRGSRFIASLPMRHGDGFGLETIDEYNLETGLSGHVLVAEDNPVNQLVIREMLDSLGVSCTIVEDGKQALHESETGEFDAVLMDCQMPHMDGYEATRRIRAREAKSGEGLPIIALTAYALASEKQRCIDAGMDDYLPKPYGRQELLGVLRRWLRETRVGTANASPSIDATVAVPTDEPPILDTRRVAEIGSLDPDGSKNLVARMLGGFLDSLPQRLAAIENAVGSGEAEAIADACHTMQSGGVNIGAARLGLSCRMLEETARAGDLDSAPDILESIRGETEALRQAIQAYDG